MIQRALLAEFLPGSPLRICSPEDLIIMKLFAGRETDLRDARSVVVRRGKANLDWDYIGSYTRELANLKEDPTVLRNLNLIRQSD